MAQIIIKIETDTPITLSDVHDMATAYNASYIEVDGAIKYTNGKMRTTSLSGARGMTSRL